MENKYILLAANILFNHRLNKTGLKSLPKKCIPQADRLVQALAFHLSRAVRRALS